MNWPNAANAPETCRRLGPAHRRPRPHRHDTYSIGRTLSGVQSFRYKGAQRHGVSGTDADEDPDLNPDAAQ
jgi:hypothetical protein